MRLISVISQCVISMKAVCVKRSRDSGVCRYKSCSNSGSGPHTHYQPSYSTGVLEINH